jgi:hypothetical protein
MVKELVEKRAYEYIPKLSEAKHQEKAARDEAMRGNHLLALISNSDPNHKNIPLLLEGQQRATAEWKKAQENYKSMKLGYSLLSSYHNDPDVASAIIESRGKSHVTLPPILATTKIAAHAARAIRLSGRVVHSVEPGQPLLFSMSAKKKTDPSTGQARLYSEDDAKAYLERDSLDDRVRKWEGRLRGMKALMERDHPNEMEQFWRAVGGPHALETQDNYEAFVHPAQFRTQLHFTVPMLDEIIT